MIKYSVSIELLLLLVLMGLAPELFFSESSTVAKSDFVGTLWAILPPVWAVIFPVAAIFMILVLFEIKYFQKYKCKS